MRNLLTTLLLSQGVPMLLAGDEFARTQGGNNNPYCQDSEIGWLDWSLDAEGEDLLAFTRRLIALRREHIVFHRSRFFQGSTIPGTEVKDVTWLRADGEEMSEAEWAEGHAKMLCLLLSGEAGLMHLTERGEQEPDDTFLLVMNASDEEITQRLPFVRAEACWQILIDTAADGGAPARGLAEPGHVLSVGARSLQLLVSCAPEAQAAAAAIRGGAA